MSTLRPRLCVLEKGSNGYGFHLHGEKGKTGQFIRLVEADSPAAGSGLLAGDRLAFVNGQSVEGESHQQVVGRIRATDGALLELVVVDAETIALLEKLDLQCRREYAVEGIPQPAGECDDHHGGGDARSTNGAPSREATPTPAAVPTPTPSENGDVPAESRSVSSSNNKEEERVVCLRPRLCHMKKGANAFGFNLHSEKTKPGQFIRAVDDDSPAQSAGLLAGDKILQVNSMSVEGLQHHEVVAAIKAGGEQVSLLVVDPETEAFFKSCNVLATEEHLTGPLPEPVSKRASLLEVNGKDAVELKPVVSVSPSPSNASSNASLPRATASPPTPEVKKAPAPAPAAAVVLSLGGSVAQAKERAHKKRSAKKAPTMDWSKRNELFSNL